MYNRLSCLGLVAFVLVGCSSPRDAAPERLASPHLPNAFRLHPKVISGGLPEGEAAFRELQQLGVKTVISVDGARPDVALAKRFGLRYVHLPHGYDGISRERVKELAKAVRDLPGPIYLHCHHGKHRSPAAATAACVSLGWLPLERARGVLQAAGTSTHYRGLYRAAESARRLDAALLDLLPAEFPETARLPAMAESMVAIEQAFDRVKKLAQHPNLSAAHESLLLREHFTELLRSVDVQTRPAEFRRALQESERTASELETLLAERRVPDAAARAKLELERLALQCTQCHRTFRDVRP